MAKPFKSVKEKGQDDWNPPLEQGMKMVDGASIALKDFEIHHNEYHRIIKAGEDVADVPDIYTQNLITEGVLPPGKEGK